MQTICDRMCLLTDADGSTMEMLAMKVGARSMVCVPLFEYSNAVGGMAVEQQQRLDSDCQTID